MLGAVPRTAVCNKYVFHTVTGEQRLTDSEHYKWLSSLDMNIAMPQTHHKHMVHKSFMAIKVQGLTRPSFNFKHILKICVLSFAGHRS